MFKSKKFECNVKKKFKAYYILKGGCAMTNINGNTCCNTCAPICDGNKGGMANYAFILVLFILLVICGAAYIF